MISNHAKIHSSEMRSTSLCVLFHASEITRFSWQLLLSRWLPEVATIGASSIQEVKEALESDHSVVVIMELHPCSTEHGVASLRSMVELVGADHIVLVCGPPTQVAARTAMQTGVSILLGCNDSIDELMRAIQAAREHLPFMSSELASLMVHSSPISDNLLLMHGTSSYALSAREEEVMNLLMAGLRPAQVASRLGLSLKTISSHKRNALGKLGVNNVLDAVRLWS